MTFEYGPDGAGVWRWRLKTADQRVIAVSGEDYADEEDCTDAILLVKYARDARLRRLEKI